VATVGQVQKHIRMNTFESYTRAITTVVTIGTDASTLRVLLARLDKGEQ
jgi:hypothetical protein